MAEMMISSPALTFLRPQELLTRLMPSVVPRTKISSFFAARVQKAPGLGAGFLVGGGGALGEFVNAAVDVGAVHFVEAADGIDDRERLLRGGGAIQVHQRLAVDVLLEDREILPDLLHVETGRDLFTQRAHEISRTGSFPANPVKTVL